MVVMNAFNATVSGSENAVGPANVSEQGLLDAPLSTITKYYQATGYHL